MLKTSETGLMSRLLTLLCLVAMAVQLTDQIDYLHTEVSLIVFVLFLFTYRKYYTRMQLNKGLLVIFLLLFGAIITAYRVIGISTANWSYISIYYGWIIYSLIGIYILDVLGLKNKKILFYGIYAATLGNIIYICVYGHRYLNIWKAHVELMANASYSSMIMVFSGICFVWFLRDKQKSSRVLSMVAIILSLYANVIILQRGTNFILTILMFALLALFNTHHKTRTMVIAFLIIIAVMLFFISGAYIPILNSLITHLDYRLGKKMTQILAYLQTGDIDAANGFSGRFYLIQTSFKTWTSSITNFFIGAGDIRGDNNIIGNHSEIIDNFARYGVVFGVMILGIFRRQIKDIVIGAGSRESDLLKRQVIIVLLINLIRNFLGTTMTGSMAIICVVFFKLMIEKCDKWDKSAEVMT